MDGREETGARGPLFVPPAKGRAVSVQEETHL